MRQAYLGLPELAQSRFQSVAMDRWPYPVHGLIWNGRESTSPELQTGPTERPLDQFWRCAWMVANPSVTQENDYPFDTCAFWRDDVCKGGCDESLFSDAPVSYGERCTGSFGQDALAERCSLRGLQSRQVLADRVHQQDWRTSAFVSVRLLQVPVQCDDRYPFP